MVTLDETPSVDVMYVAELVPPTPDGVQVVDIGDDVIPDMKEDEEAKIGKKDSNSNTFKFLHLDPKVEKYRVKIRTLVNGRTIVHVSFVVFLVYNIKTKPKV